MTTGEVKQKVDESYLKTLNSSKNQAIMNPVLLTKELDAFYHIFIDRFQKIES